VVSREHKSDPPLVHIVRDIEPEYAIAEMSSALDLQPDTCGRMESLTAQSFTFTPHSARVKKERCAQSQEPEIEHGKDAVLEVHEQEPLASKLVAPIPP
jgi:hypothetical protein